MTKAEIKEMIDAVMVSDDFGIKETVHWDKIVDKTADKALNPNWLKDLWQSILDLFDGTGDFIAHSAEFLIWFSAGFVLILITYQIIKNKQWFKSFSLLQKKPQQTESFKAFGLDIQQQSLPDNIHLAALSALSQGHLREALSLLYCGALSHFVQDHQLKINDSTTEQDCLNLVADKIPKDEADFFKNLTNSWLLSAYAHYPIKKDNIEYLCQEWQKIYAIK